jgi:hypothetical protein
MSVEVRGNTADETMNSLRKRTNTLTMTVGMKGGNRAPFAPSSVFSHITTRSRIVDLGYFALLRRDDKKISPAAKFREQPEQCAITLKNYEPCASCRW